MKYDLLIIGSGPGGYVAAIRASQLGLKTAVVERESLGGICLNWGCIPTKSLLKSAQVLDYFKHAEEYGIKIEGEVKPEFDKIVARSRNVAEGMSKGIQYLFKKNKVEVINGTGKLKSKGVVTVTDADTSFPLSCFVFPIVALVTVRAAAFAARQINIVTINKITIDFFIANPPTKCYNDNICY